MSERCRACGRFVAPVSGLALPGCEHCDERRWLPLPERLGDAEDQRPLRMSLLPMPWEVEP